MSKSPYKGLYIATCVLLLQFRLFTYYSNSPCHTSNYKCYFTSFSAILLLFLDYSFILCGHYILVLLKFNGLYSITRGKSLASASIAFFNIFSNKSLSFIFKGSFHILVISGHCFYSMCVLLNLCFQLLPVGNYTSCPCLYFNIGIDFQFCY